MSDPILQLEHDHDESRRHLRLLLSELVSQVQDVRRDLQEIHVDFQEALDAMCREVDHFTSEESVLFPAIVEVWPEASGKIELIRGSHQQVDGCVARLGALIAMEPGALQARLAELTELVQAFLVEFDRHAELEHELFAGMSAALSPEQRRQIARKLAQR
ncbi:MAG: hemerythrin domain-containing protein [Polyangiaceae bacterium]|jgi:iron-sulfur cluster repair protein YtfE (RIC family)|nr:hemerythrin domain-containing protein [Polyangiaceae bacterium]